MPADPASEIGRGPRKPTAPGADASAWLERHGDALYRYARARVGLRELAEDLVQETLLAALQSRDRFQSRSSERTWLCSILRHKIVDHYRRGEPLRRADEAEGSLDRFFTGDRFWKHAPSPWKAPEQALADSEFWRVVDGCLGDLPRILAQAFMLRELEQVEVETLCATLNLSPANLRVRLHRARLLLRDCLETRWFGSRSDEGPISK
jgi:RNA polymerase sigma-70 factor (ECF subfamily)